jgi:hypothetical protein
MPERVLSLLAHRVLLERIVLPAFETIERLAWLQAQLPSPSMIED